ncbi:hypothetical protein [Streptomyces albidoflavus]|uniref:hypothetical protein n=1 Tax=Streptomyces albidoflavus TaxID=1886 RepID=UPI0033D370F9
MTALMPERTPATTSPRTSAVTVQELNYWERAVALYVSSMPSRFRAGTVSREQMHAWMLDGVERLGLEEIRRQAQYADGYRRLWMSHLVTVEVERRHKARFPLKGRLNRAEQGAADSVFVLAPVSGCREVPEVDGVCPCGGKGYVEIGDPGLDPELSYSLDCPVHRAGASWWRGGARVAAGQAVSA